jgi:hypothetical protein
MTRPPHPLCATPGCPAHARYIVEYSGITAFLCAVCFVIMNTMPGIPAIKYTIVDPLDYDETGRSRHTH